MSNLFVMRVLGRVTLRYVGHADTDITCKQVTFV